MRYQFYVSLKLRGYLLDPSAVAHQPIKSPPDDQTYLGHKVLGPAPAECTSAALAIKNKTAQHIFGTPDDVKFLVFHERCLTRSVLATVPERGRFQLKLS